MGEKSNAGSGGGATDSAGGQGGDTSTPPDGWVADGNGQLYRDPKSNTTFDPKTGVYSWPNADGQSQHSMTEPTADQKTEPCATCGNPRPLSAGPCPHCGMK